jgi:DNA repair exonuclease SbcCD nuclease subunit
LGARFAQFGDKAAALRQARLVTLRRALGLAQEHAVDAFLIAGDLFEDNQVAESLVAEAIALFRAHPTVPVFILPGNHDPASGPDSVWSRKAFRTLPPHVHVLAQPGVTLLEGAALLASPLTQKLSSVDPSRRFVELAATVPAGLIKIGITHGALAIEGKHAPNDFPIALNAASRAGLDYLAIGHWHSWLADTDDGRIVMPGTPEPDRFANERSGHLALVEIAGAGQPPRVQALSVNTLTWRSLAFDFLSVEASRAAFASAVTELGPQAGSAVVRVTLAGTASPALLAETRGELEAALAPFLAGQIVDRTRVALSAGELADLRARHPLLAQTLADIDRLESLATGVPVPDSAPASPGAAGSAPLTLAEIQALLGPARIELAQLTPEFFAGLRQMLFQTLQEVTP